MNKQTPSNEQELVSCEICLKSIPRSDATNAEKEDYVVYFCGLDCYEQWNQKQSKEKSADKDT